MCSSYILTNAVPLFLLFSLVRLVHCGAGEALLQMLVSSPAHHILLLSLLLQLAPKGDNVPSLLHVWAVFVKLHCSVDYSEQVLSEGTVVWSSTNHDRGKRRVRTYDFPASIHSYCCTVSNVTNAHARRHLIMHFARSWKTAV